MGLCLADADISLCVNAKHDGPTSHGRKHVSGCAMQGLMDRACFGSIRGSGSCTEAKGQN